MGKIDDLMDKIDEGRRLSLALEKIGEFGGYHLDDEQKRDKWLCIAKESWEALRRRLEELEEEVSDRHWWDIVHRDNESFNHHVSYPN